MSRECPSCGEQIETLEGSQRGILWRTITYYENGNDDYGDWDDDVDGDDVSDEVRCPMCSG